MRAVLANWPHEVARLTWIDNHDWQLMIDECGDHRGFVATAGFQHDPLGCHRG